MSDSFVERLEQRIAAGAAPACVGIDPRPDRLPVDLPGADAAERILAFVEAVVPRIAAHVPAVKPNIAFFEALGWQGYRAWEATCRIARDAGLLVVGDVKRGDIGSTAEAYAEAHYRHCDALTVSPYLGGDSLRPFLDRCRDEGRGLFVLVRTSNPGADTIQSLALPGGETVAERVARAVDRWGEETSSTGGFSHVGAVVGATRPAELARLRGLMPRAVLLIPGVGAQGGRIEDCAAAFDGRGLGGLVNQSRGILQCFEPDASDWRERVGEAARTFAADLRRVVAANVQGGTVSP